jgi:hypothetical protein
MAKVREIMPGRRPTRDDYNALAKEVNRIAKIKGRNGIRVNSTPSGISLVGSVSEAGGANINIYAITSIGTGTGVYNCTKQQIIAANWGSIEGANVYEDIDDTSFEVLNLHEVGPEPSVWAHDAVYEPRRVTTSLGTTYRCIRFNTATGAAEPDVTSNEPGVGDLASGFWTETLSSHILTPGHRIAAWTETDDEGNARLVGLDLQSTDVNDILDMFDACTE